MLDVRKLAALREIAAHGSFSAPRGDLATASLPSLSKSLSSSARLVPCSSSAGDAGYG